MTAEAGTRLRADARRNRDQIMAAAKEVFAELGPDVPMEEIARRAGVGVGTLYRRFPDREALIRAVAQENFGAVLDDARAATAEEPTAWDALVRLMRRSRDLRLSVRLAVLSPSAWAAMRDDPQIRQLRDGIMAALDDLVRAAQAEGVLRDDVGPGDVAALVSLLLRRVPADSDATAELIAERALVVILDGLRADPGSPLPGRPVTIRDLGD
ncbi:TetR/AcrR family transcriptional regulator [Rugosimonospora acidiphila]|uniref:TetR/AcrR family transcriptional regulator n=1 Tax=Rugosimonospora acidiphila TaxID=556531 RepID=A0ABP9RVD3_9ACTN